MNDKVLCPWCGAEMFHCGIKRTYDWEGNEVCGKCGATSPKRWAISQDAVRAQSKAAALLRYTLNKWRSVKDSFPEADGKYIVCTTKGSVYCAKFTTRHGAYFHTDMNTHIAYWMPMPDAPTDGERSTVG